MKYIDVDLSQTNKRLLEEWLDKRERGVKFPDIRTSDLYARWRFLSYARTRMRAHLVTRMERQSRAPRFTPPQGVTIAGQRFSRLDASARGDVWHWLR